MMKDFLPEKGLNKMIRLRKSSVIFNQRMVSEEKIRLLFEAARWAPSSRNTQPWRFICGLKNDTTYEKLFECLQPGNKEWAGNAPLLILTLAEMITTYKNQPNKYAWHDVGLATSMLLLQATHMGLYAHPMGGFLPDMAKDFFEIPERFEPVAMIAVGYLGNVNDFPKNLVERELTTRERKPLEQIVFRGKWNIESENSG